MPQALYPRHYTPGEEAPVLSTYVGPRSCLDALEKKRNFLALPGFEPRLLGLNNRNNNHYADYTNSFPASAKETCRYKVLSNHNAAGFTLINAVLQFNICYSNEVNRGRDKSCM